MSIDEYQKKVHEISQDSTLSFSILGLTHGVDQVAGEFRKILRDNSGRLDPDHQELMAHYLGDIAWHLAACCTALDLPLSWVMERTVTGDDR